MGEDPEQKDTMPSEMSEPEPASSRSDFRLWQSFGRYRNDLANSTLDRDVMLPMNELRYIYCSLMNYKVTDHLIDIDIGSGSPDVRGQERGLLKLDHLFLPDEVLPFLEEFLGIV
ncbi:hypothetical protein M8J75_009514 [Diaphorina citri]|nr:hypothetical protein M8J75_009514 [Diaphorina citri]